MFGVMTSSILVGVAVTVSIFAFYSFIAVSGRERAFQKRMATVRDDRSALRAAHLAQAGAESDKKDAQARKIEAALEKLKLSRQLTNEGLKARLMRAGYRKHRHVVGFAIMQLVGAPIMAIFAYIAYNVTMAPGEIPLTTLAAILIGGALFGYIAPGMHIDGVAANRQKDIRRAFPDVLDLMTICVESGMPVEQSFNKVAQEMDDSAQVMVEEMRLTTAELSFLGDRRMALDNFAERTGLPEVRAIVSALAQAERYGTSVGQALRVISNESRFERMSRAESKAASLPAKLTVPMMVFFLPVLFVVILGPAILQIMNL